MNKNPKPRTGITNLPKEKIQEILKRFSSTSTKDLAKELDLKPATIRIIASRARIKKNYWQWQQWQDDLILNDYKQYGWQHIANNTSRTKWAIINRYRYLIGKRE